MLIDSCGILVFENLDDFAKDTWRNGDIFVCPWDVFNNGDLDRGEVLIAKSSFLCLCPS